jgi:DNA repair exonuclease SbcCD ATPase subunit
MAAPSIAERIKAARSAPRDFRDVDIVLDQAVAEQVTALEEQIGAKESEVADLETEKERIRPDLRMSDPRLAKIDKQIEGIEEAIGKLEEQRDDLRRGTLVRLRFDKLEGEQWAAIAAKHPARLDSSIDRLSGYNYHATAREAAPICGYALGDGDAKESLSAEDWKGLYEVMSGREIENIAASLWEMNDWAPRRRIDAARKVSADGSGSKSS